MNLRRIENWLLSEIESGADPVSAKETLDYFRAMESAREEIEDQIKLTNSEIIQLTLEHVRDDILNRRLSLEEDN